MTILFHNFLIDAIFSNIFNRLEYSVSIWLYHYVLITQLVVQCLYGLHVSLSFCHLPCALLFCVLRHSFIHLHINLFASHFSFIAGYDLSLSLSLSQPALSSKATHLAQLRLYTICLCASPSPLVLLLQSAKHSLNHYHYLCPAPYFSPILSLISINLSRFGCHGFKNMSRLLFLGIVIFKIS